MRSRRCSTQDGKLLSGECSTRPGRVGPRGASQSEQAYRDRQEEPRAQSLSICIDDEFEFLSRINGLFSDEKPCNGVSTLRAILLRHRHYVDGQAWRYAGRMIVRATQFYRDCRDGEPRAACVALTVNRLLVEVAHFRPRREQHISMEHVMSGPSVVFKLCRRADEVAVVREADDVADRFLVQVREQIVVVALAVHHVNRAPRARHNIFPLRQRHAPTAGTRAWGLAAESACWFGHGWELCESRPRPPRLPTDREQC